MERMTSNSEIMAAFSRDLEDGASVRTAGALNTMVQMRPVGAQAITIKREIDTILRELRTFAAAAGETWYYSWDVNDKHSRRADGKTTIEGPSVKLANDLARLYGNCTAGVDRVEDAGTHWVMFAKFVDFETGYEYVRPFQQRKSQTPGGRMDSDRAMDIAFQIGVSKATRNCIVNALGTLSDFAMAEAKNAIVGRVEKDLGRYLERVLLRLDDFGVDPAKVERLIGRPVAQWTARDVAKLISQIQAIQEGMTTAEELWSDKPEKVDEAAPAKTLADFAQDKAPAKTEARDTAEKIAAKAQELQQSQEKPQESRPADEGTGQAISTGEERVNPEDDKPREMVSARDAMMTAGRSNMVNPTEQERAANREETIAARASSNPGDAGDIPDFLKRAKEPEQEADPSEKWQKLASQRYPKETQDWRDGYAGRCLGTRVAPPLSQKRQSLWMAGWMAADGDEGVPDLPRPSKN